LSEDNKVRILLTAYQQAHSIYLNFVGFRFEMISIILANASVFYFIYEKGLYLHPNKYFFIAAFSAIFVTWILYLLDLRNKQILYNAIDTASNIEEFLNENYKIVDENNVQQEFKSKPLSKIFISYRINNGIFEHGYYKVKGLKGMFQNFENNVLLKIFNHSIVIRFTTYILTISRVLFMIIKYS